MSGETLTRKFLVKSQEKLTHNFLTYGLRYTLFYCLNLKADRGLCQQKMLKADDIRNGNSADYKKYLGTVIEESDNIEDVRKAAELLVKLAEYKPLANVEELEEVNINQIDNVLSNTVPKSEEKREARQTEQERLEELQRIEEEGRKRRARGERPSLRARLAAKKAIVAANGAVPPKRNTATGAK